MNTVQNQDLDVMRGGTFSEIMLQRGQRSAMRYIARHRERLLKTDGHWAGVSGAPSEFYFNEEGK